MEEQPYPRKVISSGQTGVDRAGLDAALEVGLPIGGYVPKGRLAEDGRVPEKYPMTELTTQSYPVRTRRNVVAADGTLILADGRLTRGTSLTARYARENSRPLLIVQLVQVDQAPKVREWLQKNRIEVLNIAGSRESGTPGIHARAKAFLTEVLGGKTITGISGSKQDRIS